MKYRSTRSSRSLSLAEHEEASRGIAAGRSLRSIALRPGRATSTVSRELSRKDGRAVPGHWDGDLRIGGNNRQIATLVECCTRYVMLVSVNSIDTETVINAFS